MDLVVLGASGRTGRHLVNEALARGHTVRALVRRPDALEQRPGLTLVVGDAMDGEAVRRASANAQAVISALGVTADKQPICSTAMQHLLAAGAERVVTVSGAGLDVPGDRKGPVDRFAGWLVRTISPQAFADKVREFDLVRASGIRWTLVRPPQLADGPGGKAVKVAVSVPQGIRIDRIDLARFCLDTVEADRFIREAPFVAT